MSTCQRPLILPQKKPLVIRWIVSTILPTTPSPWVFLLNNSYSGYSSMTRKDPFPSGTKWLPDPDWNQESHSHSSKRSESCYLGTTWTPERLVLHNNKKRLPPHGWTSSGTDCGLTPPGRESLRVQSTGSPDLSSTVDDAPQSPTTHRGIGTCDSGREGPTGPLLLRLPTQFRSLV